VKNGDIPIFLHTLQRKEDRKEERNEQKDLEDKRTSSRLYDGSFSCSLDYRQPWSADHFYVVQPTLEER